MMKWRDLKIGWRLLIKEPAHSLMIILGLSLSFSACFLLLGYAKYSFDYDSHIPNAERLFLVKHRVHAFARPVWVSIPFMKFKESMGNSGIPNQVVSVSKASMSVLTATNKSFAINTAAVSNNFPDNFAVKTVQGNLAKTLAKPDEIALTVKTASKLFGTQKALGNTLQIDGKSFAVSALIQDPPSNTTVGFDALIGNQNEGTSTYIYLPSNVDVGMVEQYLQSAADNSGFAKFIEEKWLLGVKPNLGKKSTIEIRLNSLKGAYFDRDLGNFDELARGDRSIITALVVVAVFILLLASTSFINLTVARTIRRQREIGVYKMLGANRFRIASQFIAESLLLSFIASGFGLLLSWFILPLFADLMNRQLDSLFSVSNLALSLLFSLLIGLLLSSYPTWIAFNVNANQALVGRGNHESTGGMRLRRNFTIFQFSSAIAFSAIALAIAWQTFYATTSSLGFSSDNLLVLNTAVSSSESQRSAFKEELQRLPGVLDVATSNQAMGRDFIGGNAHLKLGNGSSVAPIVHFISHNFFDLHEVKMIAGRSFDPKIETFEKSNSIILNANAIAALGFTTPESALGQFITRSASASAPMQIIGVVSNLRFQNTHETESPRSYELRKNMKVLSIKLESDSLAMQEKIATLWQQFFPNEIMDMRTSTNIIAQNYAEDLRLAKLLVAAAMLALLNAALGIYVLSAYSIQRRAQEIAIRKIYGAKGKAIAGLLGKEILHVIVISAAFGLPIGAYVVWSYLSGFVEHAPIGGWTLLLSLVLTLLVAFVASLKHTLTAMQTSPVIVLRN